MKAASQKVFVHKHYDEEQNTHYELMSGYFYKVVSEAASGYGRNFARN